MGRCIREGRGGARGRGQWIGGGSEGVGEEGEGAGGVEGSLEEE